MNKQPNRKWVVQKLPYSLEVHESNVDLLQSRMIYSVERNPQSEADARLICDAVNKVLPQ